MKLSMARSALAVALWLAPQSLHAADEEPEFIKVYEYSGPVLDMERFKYEIDWPSGFKVCGYPEATSFTGFFFVTDKTAECEPDYRLHLGSFGIHGNHNVIESELDLDSQVRESCKPRRRGGNGTIIGYFGKWAGERSIACQITHDDGTITLVIHTQSPVPPAGSHIYPGVGAYSLRAYIVTDPERFNRDRATLRRVLRGFRWTVQ